MNTCLNHGSIVLFESEECPACSHVERVRDAHQEIEECLRDQISDMEERND